MKCLIVDDDPLVCETVELWLARVDGVEFCLKAEDGLTALNLISTGEFDLIFLDLQMPGLDGETLLRSIPQSLPVIVISASEEFGARSYEFGVLDYLIKPMEFSRFFRAVQRAKEVIAQRKGTAPKEVPPPTSEAVFVRDGSRLVKLDLSRLLYIKAEANYVSFVGEAQQVMSLMSMKRADELLGGSFVRIHRSWMVNLEKIDRVEAGCVVIRGEKLPVGENYREALGQRLNVVN